MSASAPLGKPSKNMGSVEADCTSATHSGVVVMDVINQAAATSFIHMQMLATSAVLQSRRNTGYLIGPQAESDSGGGGGVLDAGIQGVLSV